MRYDITAILIACGTLMSLAPMASEIIQVWQLAEAVSPHGAADSAHFMRQALEETYQLGTWLLGGAMIALGVCRSWCELVEDWPKC